MSGNERQRVLYWDACIYLAWLKNEDNGIAVNEGIAEAAEENWHERNLIITSTLTFVEVLEAKLTADEEGKFRQIFRKQLHSARDLDPPIAMKARNFRGAFLQSGTKRLATPDAIHLATASVFKVDEFWTMDGGGKDRKSLSLLDLNGHTSIDSLTIRKPYAKNPSLPGLTAPTGILTELPVASWKVEVRVAAEPPKAF